VRIIGRMTQLNKGTYDPLLLQPRRGDSFNKETHWTHRWVRNSLARATASRGEVQTVIPPCEIRREREDTQALVKLLKA
jgi:hypothetical protein